ncbi:hypothetical protein NKW43_12180 [Gluconobacter albidus]|uniref:hypothetical protein n=1 Tax=Gluconobacter albidus TaxID=318683 RepID=UPI0020A11C12|nr:hypothetical protein [Gluconobacter albidus]MCP1274433.1 hypothetical protein [Gluconobacter albidus]
MKTMIPLIASFTLVGLASSASASGLHAVRPVQGYTCMALNQTREQAMDFDHPATFRQGPSDTAADAGLAGAQVAIKTGADPVNGYLPTLRTDFKPAWVKASLVKPYAVASDPKARCVPAVMSNGSQGFMYPRD